MGNLERYYDVAREASGATDRQYIVYWRGQFVRKYDDRPAALRGTRLLTVGRRVFARHYIPAMAADGIHGSYRVLHRGGALLYDAAGQLRAFLRADMKLRPMLLSCRHLTATGVPQAGPSLAYDDAAWLAVDQLGHDDRQALALTAWNSIKDVY